MVFTSKHKSDKPSVWREGTVFANEFYISKNGVPCSVVVGVPKILKDNEILMNSIKRVIPLLEERDMLLNDKSVYQKRQEQLYFNAELYELEKKYKTLFDRLHNIETEIDSGIAPFRWRIEKDVDSVIEDNQHIKGNWGLFLVEDYEWNDYKEVHYEPESGI